jgi:mono/diheme cytochrome c family protein
MARQIQRIEIRVDAGPEPVQVLEQPPFTLRLDTTGLADGDHTLRVVTFFEGGGRDQRDITFAVDNLPGVIIDGLDDGDVVRGSLELGLEPGRPPAEGLWTRARSVLYAASTVLVLGGVWAFFAFTPPAGQLLAAVTAAPAAAEKTPVDKDFYDAGEKLFTQNCQSCHQANGKGVDDAFPPLAGNTNLKDLGLVVKTVKTGKTGHVSVEGESFNSVMPPIGGGFSAKEIAEVATYIRNSWGNDFGGVTVDQVEKNLPGGSSGG